MTADPMGEELAADPVRADEEDVLAAPDSAREHLALLEQARASTLLPGEAASEPQTFLSVMGIDLAPRHAEEDVLLTSDAEDMVGTESDSPATTGAGRAPLVEEVYADETKALRRRLEQQQRQHDLLIEKVAAGLAGSDALAKSRRAMRVTKDAIEDARALEAHARVLAQQRARRIKVEGFHAAINQVEADLTAAVEDAEAIDRLATELGAAVARFRARLESIGTLRKQAYSFGGKPMLESLDRWSNEPGNLEFVILNVLKAERVLSDKVRVAPPGYSDRRVAPWAGTFAYELVAAARGRAPVLALEEEDSDDGGDTHE